MSCGYCGVGGHDINHCPERLEEKFGTTGKPSATTDSLTEEDDE